MSAGDARPKRSTARKRVVAVVVMAGVAATVALVVPRPTTLAVCDAKDFNLRASCYSEHARATGNPALCENSALNEQQQGECVQRVEVATGDGDVCRRLTARDAIAWCSYRVAEAREDPELCADVQTKDIADRCFGDVAQARHEPELCARVFDFRARGKCLSESLPRGTDPRLCDQQADESLRDSCRAALARNDASLCPSLSESLRASCAVDHVREVDEPAALCGGSVKCLLETATLDLRSCDLIGATATADRERCIERAVPPDRWTSESVCEQLQDEQSQNECLLRVAMYNFHESACARISQASLREACQSRAQKYQAFQLRQPVR